MPTPPPDPLKRIQADIVRLCQSLAPGRCPEELAVTDRDGKKIITLPLHLGCAAHDAETVSDADEVKTVELVGWSFTERHAFFGNKRIPVGATRIRLLRVLAEADGPLPAKELRQLAFDRETTDGNVFSHITALRNELRAAFPDFPGEIIPNDDGYWLALKPDSNPPDCD